MAVQPIEVVVLAAGQGKRMRSTRPKVLHHLAGRPLLAHVLDTAAALQPQAIHLVVGHGGDQVRQAFADRPLQWAEQQTQLGTGHAVAQALPAVADESLLLVLYGDVPLVALPTLQQLLSLAATTAGVALLTLRLDDPHGYGRIVRTAAGAVQAIVEQKDADAATCAINEVNSGIMALPAAQLRDWLTRIGNDNAQGEFYLTDVVALAVADGVAVTAHTIDDSDEVLGVNDRAQLAHLERVWQRRQADALLASGVTLIDPARIDVRGELIAGEDCVIDVNGVFEGRVRLGRGVRIGANCLLRDCDIGDEVVIEPMSLIEQSQVAAHCTIGPFARLRPGSELAAGAKIGNFVEVKKSRIGRGSKVNHLSYIGDTEMGEGVNIGAGTITCNYDGANKHQTIIGDRAFIGSDTQLIAPVTVGADATIGAGSTIARDAPAAELSVSRTKQRTIPGWQRPKKRIN